MFAPLLCYRGSDGWLGEGGSVAQKGSGGSVVHGSCYAEQLQIYCVEVGVGLLWGRLYVEI